MRYFSTNPVKAGDTSAHRGEVYLREIDQTLPRLLALIDLDPLSPTYGVADRQYWGWKLIDFPNATFQGMAHGLALLLADGRFAKTIDPASIKTRIEALFLGTKTITRRSGHLEEAFPFERSFCVTALVAFDLLCALDCLEKAGIKLDIDQPERIIEPLINALMVSDETHGLISNHLATAAAALFHWDKRCCDVGARKRAEMFLRRILDNQSDEGWFVEYAGADPGYQTLCTSYLSDCWKVTGNAELHEALEQSVHFLSHFAHPDGSFGGLYGSRATRIYYPAGLEILGASMPKAAALAAFMQRSIQGHLTVPLSAIDPPNLAPLFNNYAKAATLDLKATTPLERLAIESGKAYRRHMPKAGLIIDVGLDHQTIISTHKGGIMHQVARDGSSNWQLRIDPGIACKSGRRTLTNQRYEAANQVRIEGDLVIIQSNLSVLASHRPHLWNFLILRLLCASFMQIPTIGEWVKRTLAAMLISGKAKSLGRLERRITLGVDPKVEDRIMSDKSLEPMDLGNRPFSAIHMASQGYWQINDAHPACQASHKESNAA